MGKYVLIGICLLGFASPVGVRADSRIWSVGDKTVEAEYINIIGGRLVLKTLKGKIIKAPLESLSPEDREYLELLNFPEFVIGFLKKADQRFVETGPYFEDVIASFTGYEFGVRIRQDERMEYAHELKIEYWAIGNEVKTYGNKYILLDQGASAFTPSAENNRSHSFTGEEIELIQHVHDNDKRGQEYFGYVITVTDIRGEIIVHHESNKWLWENLDKIKQLPVGAYFDKEGNRTHPTRPKSTRY